MFQELKIQNTSCFPRKWITSPFLKPAPYIPWSGRPWDRNRKHSGQKSWKSPKKKVIDPFMFRHFLGKIEWAKDFLRCQGVSLWLTFQSNHIVHWDVQILRHYRMNTYWVRLHNFGKNKTYHPISRNLGKLCFFTSIFWIPHVETLPGTINVAPDNNLTTI